MDLNKFLSQHGLGQRSEKDEPFEKSAELQLQRHGHNRAIYCGGCGRVLEDLGTAEAQSERNFGMHMKCYREALQKMETLRRQNPNL